MKKKYCVGHVISEPIPGVDIIIVDAADPEEAIEAFLTNYAQYYAADEELFEDIWIDEIFYRLPDGSYAFDPETGNALADKEVINAAVLANVHDFFKDRQEFEEIYVGLLKDSNGYKAVMTFPEEMRHYMVYTDLKNDPNEEIFAFCTDELEKYGN